jgi:pyruvate/2-oxoglutarate dehydrogenase complex dihydrolipoamide dehydrogenase (E3) component
LPFIPHSDPRVIDSTGALELGGIPKRLLVLGGGIIGLEMATVYHALGARVTVVELMDQIIPRCRPRHRHPAAQADREAVREHLPEDQGDARRQGRGRGGGGAQQLLRRQGDPIGRLLLFQKIPCPVPPCI